MAISIARQPRLLVLDQVNDGLAGTGRGLDRLVPIKESLEAVGVPTAIEAVHDSAGLVQVLEREAPALVFPTFFRFSGIPEPGTYLSQGFREFGVSPIGSGDRVLELALSKPHMKAQWRRDEIPTPDWFVVSRSRDGALVGLERLDSARDFPYFVKPSTEGNSRGIDSDSIVRTPLQLLARATMVAEKYGEALVEGYLGGGEDSAEFTVAMVGNGRDAIVSGVQVGRAGEGIITEDRKESHQSRVAPIADPRMRRAVERLARKAFLSAGVKDYARCDILLHGGRLYAIELNGQPMVPDRWFAACCLEAGLGDKEYPRAIVLSAILRTTKSGESFIPVPPGLVRGLPHGVVAQLSGKPTRVANHE